MRGGFRQFVFQKSVFLKHPSVRVLPILPKWSSPPLLRLEGVRTLSTRILWLEHVVCNIEGGHLPLLQVLRGQAEGVLLHLQPPLGLSGDDLALDSDAELWTEELREGDGGEEEGMTVPGLLVHHQLVFGEEGLHEPGQSVAGVVGFVGVHALLLLVLFLQLVTLVDLRIVEERIWQVLQEQGPRSTSSFPASILSIPENHS